jgi:hypothetical protein
MANPTLLDMPIARDGNKNTIPTTDNGTTGLLSQQYGWQQINAIPPQQGGKAVKREDFNGALYLLSNLLFYLQKGWQFEWDSNQAYYTGCIVKDTSDGKMYQCLNDITSTTAPHSDTTNWKVCDLSNYLPLAGGGALTGSSLTWNGNDLGGSSIVASSWGSTSGYFKTSKGMIFAYGIDLVSTAGTPITFPITFSQRAIVSITNLDNDLTLFQNICINNPTGTGFTAKAQSANQSCEWIAIGF